MPIHSIYRLYQLGAELSSYQQGEIRRALHIQSGLKCQIMVAIKEKVFETIKSEDTMLNMLEIMYELLHPKILATYAYLHDQYYFYVV